MNERDFKGIFIPKTVWCDKRLNAVEKMILMEIDSLDNEDGCFASNEYLANFCQCTTRKISDAISKLQKLQYLEIVSFDGRKRKIKTKLSLEKFSRLGRKFCEAIYNRNRNNKLENKGQERKYTEEELEALFDKIDDLDL